MLADGWTIGGVAAVIAILGFALISAMLDGRYWRRLKHCCCRHSGPKAPPTHWS